MLVALAMGLAVGMVVAWLKSGVMAILIIDEEEEIEEYDTGEIEEDDGIGYGDGYYRELIGTDGSRDV